MLPDENVRERASEPAARTAAASIRLATRLPSSSTPRRRPVALRLRLSTNLPLQANRNLACTSKSGEVSAFVHSQRRFSPSRTFLVGEDRELREDPRPGECLLRNPFASLSFLRRRQRLRRRTRRCKIRTTRKVSPQRAAGSRSTTSV